MGLIENMRDAVEFNGGKLTEEQYLEKVLEIIESEGGSTSIASLKSNAFNSARMEKAGITRLTIGKDKFVWTTAMVEGMLSGNATPMPTTTMVNNVNAPEATDDGYFYGIRRRSPDEYPEHMQAYIIPRGSLKFVESEKGEMRLLAVAFKNGWYVSSNGPKGCGKTMAMMMFASEVGIPFMRINCSEGFTEESFIGYNTLIDGEITWIDGVLPESLRYGAFLCFDEFRHARPEIMTAWNPVGDSGTLVLPQNNNEVIKAHADFRTFATMNPIEGYSGGQDVNQATSDRFAMSLEATYLPADSEIRVICEQSGVSNPAIARQFVQLANDLRNLKAQHDLESDTSTRMLISMMQATTDLSVAEIVEYIMIGRYQPHEAELIKTTARARLSDY
jgi:cobaltochelatase CobS